MSVAGGGPTSRVFFSQRLRLHYVDWGNPDAPPLLLLHGGRDHCRNWDWVAAAFRDQYHVICPDLRGHGDSAWSPSGHYGMADYIYDLAQLIHQQKLAPLSIVAHSLGGNIALRYTGVFPENVRKLVAIEGLGPAPAPTSPRTGSRFPSGSGPGSRKCAAMPGASRTAMARSSRRSPACRRPTPTCRRRRRVI